MYKSIRSIVVAGLAGCLLVMAGTASAQNPKVVKHDAKAVARTSAHLKKERKALTRDLMKGHPHAAAKMDAKIQKTRHHLHAEKKALKKAKG